MIGLTGIAALEAEMRDRLAEKDATILRLQTALCTVLDLTMAIEQSQETRLHDIYDVAAAALPDQRDDTPPPASR